MSDIQTTVNALLAAAVKAAEDPSTGSGRALQFTQAALNAAHTKHALLDYQLPPYQPFPQPVIERIEPSAQ